MAPKPTLIEPDPATQVGAAPGLTHEKSEMLHMEAAEQQLNEIDLNRLSRDALSWRSRATLRLAVVIMLQGLSVAAFAIDGSVIGSIASIPEFREYFGVGTSGDALGLIIAGMAIGNAIASPFQWLSDLIGRRGVTCLGNVILVVGATLQAAAPNNACLVVGRVIAGAGCSLSATVGPMYMSEVSPACYRGLAVGLYCSCYSIGAVAIACILLGGSYIPGNWSWRMPLVVQIMPPVLVACLVYLVTPESPRYLVSVGKVGKAKEVIAKYHTSSERTDDPIVTATINQIQGSLELSDAKPWDFRTLYKTKSARYRMWVIFLYSFFQQWNGTGLLTYYLPGILTLVGITNTQQQLGINVGMTVAAYLSTLAGSAIIDHVTRRLLLISTMGVFIFFLCLMTIVGGLYANGIAINAMGILTILFAFLFNIANGFFSSALHNIYPNEVLHYSQRAKGMGMYSFFQNCFGFGVTYGGSAALAALEWKVYTIFIGIDIVCMYLTWQFFPEFLGLSLEEIDLVFETEGVHPVKMSKELQQAKKRKRREEKELGKLAQEK